MKKSLIKVLSIIMAAVMLIGGTSVVSFAEDGEAAAEASESASGISAILGQLNLLPALLDIFSHLTTALGLPAISGSEDMAEFADSIVAVLEPLGIVAIYDMIINNTTATQFLQKAIEIITNIYNYFK